jgi:glutathionylspermidine synthase
MARRAPLPERRQGSPARRLADHFLLRWCQQSGPGEARVAAPAPLAINPALASSLRSSAVALDSLLRRFADGLLARDEALADFALPDFPLAKDAYARGPLRTPFFWGRFDIFERAGGGLAALEYNCDKPAGQREIWASEEVGPARSNPNRGARARFRRELADAWRRHAGRSRKRPRLAILCDPAHREEFRLAYLFGEEAHALGWEWDVVDPLTLTVENGRAAAYGTTVDVVLRHYPSEYLHELPAARGLLDARVLWLNDPRAVVAQAKSAFAALWALFRDGRWLTRAEGALVERLVPPTGLASQVGWLDRARARPEDWVLKPVLGRYSERVAVGALASPDEWQAALDAAAASPREWVVQAFVPPRRRWLPSSDGERPGYVNWGVYLAGGEPAGICPRCQPTPLTDEGTVWWAPLILRRERAVKPALLEPARMKRRGSAVGAAWRAVADRHALRGYTNTWTDGLANFTLAAIGLMPGACDELSHATLVLGRAVGRVLAHLRGRPELLGILGIPETLAPLCATVAAGQDWSFLSRFDWAWTADGRWKLLEINSDTPAGLWETGSIEGDVARLHPAATPLSGEFWPMLASSWRRWVERSLGDCAADRLINLGLIGALGSPEDADQLRAHARAAREALPRARLQIATPDDLTVGDGGVSLAGRRLDLLFRYYPLDWLAEPRWAPLVDAAARGHIALLPPAHALIPQSKAFLALLWELEAQGFFPPAEAATIKRYVALTALGPEPFGRKPYVIKPYLEREGLGVRFSQEVAPRERRQLVDGPVVCQERLDVFMTRVPVATGRGWKYESRHLIFGVFLAGNEVAGVYTRAGARITGREAVFVPALLRARPGRGAQLQG